MRPAAGGGHASRVESQGVPSGAVKKTNVYRCSLNWLVIFVKTVYRALSSFQVSGMGSYNSACYGERGGLVGGGGCGTRGGGDGAASGGRDLKSQVSCGDGLA